jgi:hypothetical protein
MNKCVLQDWVLELPFQMQTTLMSALRAPDGRVEQGAKSIVTFYRGSLLKGGSIGRPLVSGEGCAYMRALPFENPANVGRLFQEFLRHADALPFHAYDHFREAIEIMGYHHADPAVRDAWGGMYKAMCDALHVNPETKEQLDARLNDWGREPEQVIPPDEILGDVYHLFVMQGDDVIDVVKTNHLPAVASNISLTDKGMFVVSEVKSANTLDGRLRYFIAVHRSPEEYRYTVYDTSPSLGMLPAPIGHLVLKELVTPGMSVTLSNGDGRFVRTVSSVLPFMHVIGTGVITHWVLVVEKDNG